MSLRRSSRIQPLTTAASNGINNDATTSVKQVKSKKKVPESKKSKDGSSTGPAASTNAEKMQPPPSTPQKKRKLTQDKTKEVTADMDIVLPNGGSATASPARKRRVRPAGADISNAALQTPRGGTLVAYPSFDESSSPSKSAKVPPPLTHATSSTVTAAATTTENLLKQACAHLIAVDPNLKSLVESHHCVTFSPEGLADKIDPFEDLCRMICAQQVSGAAAKSICNKFIALFNADVAGPSEHVFPKPAAVAVTDIPRLRTAGLSERKAEYIQGLAAKFASGEFSAEMLLRASDEEILEKLTAVRGLGRWSVEMFACFSLKRIDIFSTGDLGVQRGMAAYMGKDVNKLKAKGGKWKYMNEADMLDISQKFAPYRSLFMWYMWRVEDVDVSVMTSTTKK